MSLGDSGTPRRTGTAAMNRGRCFTCHLSRASRSGCSSFGRSRAALCDVSRTAKFLGVFVVGFMQNDSDTRGEMKRGPEMAIIWRIVQIHLRGEVNSQFLPHFFRRIFGGDEVLHRWRCQTTVGGLLLWCRRTDGLRKCNAWNKKSSNTKVTTRHTAVWRLQGAPRDASSGLTRRSVQKPKQAPSLSNLAKYRAQHPAHPFAEQRGACSWTVKQTRPF